MLPLLLLLLLLPPTLSQRGGRPKPSHQFGDFIAVANRGSGTISLVNNATLLPTTYVLPDAAEPMYFACLYRPFANRPAELWVGDRANNRLAIILLKRDKLIPAGFIPTPAGLFHSMTTQRIAVRRPLAFSTCDVANVTVVHNIKTRELICTMFPPKIVRKLGGRPHDVTSDDEYAFVTYIGASNGRGYVAAYIARTCKLLTFIDTAADPHVSVRPRASLFVAAQGGEVHKRTVPWMKLERLDRSQTSPHGIFMGFNRRFVYVTNIADGGENAIVTYRQKTGKLVDCPRVRSTFAVPHNPTLAFNNRRLYMTHSLAEDNVNSVWDIDERGCVKPDSEVIFRTGKNPFGIVVQPPPIRRLVMQSVNSR